MALSIKLSDSPLDNDYCLKFINGNQPTGQFIVQAVLTNQSSKSERIEFASENDSFIQMTQIAQELIRRFRLPRAIIHHRIGSVQPNDALIYLAFAGSDGTMTFEACDRAITKICNHNPNWQKQDFEIRQIGLAAQTG